MFSFIPPITKNEQRAVFLCVIVAIALTAAIVSMLMFNPDNQSEPYRQEDLGEADIDISPQK